MKVNRIICAVVIAVIGISQDASAQSTEIDEASLREVLDIFRSNLNTGKIEVINQVMRLTEDEAEKFWPIYRDYEEDSAALSDRKAKVIGEFVTQSENGTLNDESANDLAKRWLDVTEDRLKLWKKYHRRISRALTPTRGAQFLQVEHQIALFVDINIAAEMPVIGLNR